MRIALVSAEYPPLVLTGVATHTEGLASALVRAGHEVVVLTLQHPTVDDDVVNGDGVRVVRASIDLPWIPEHEDALQVASANHQLVGLVRHLGRWQPDVIHCHDWVTAWAGITLRDLLGVPLVATIHATERGRHGGYVPAGLPGVINSVEMWLAGEADAVVCCSAFMRREIIDGFDLDPAKLHLIPNGVSPQMWAPPDPPPQRDSTIVAWGRVNYEKGFQVLAGAVARLRGRVPDLRCVIAGTGSYLPDLQMQIDVEGVNDITQLVGFAPDPVLHSLLHTAGCAVIPSLYEPFGIVALEAMAAGAPIVAARTGGLAEILGASGAGVLFEPGNPEALAEAIAEVMLSPTRSAELRINAERLLGSKYSWDAIGLTTAQVYASI